MPKISIIVPVYKVEKYINRCIDSILNQSFNDFELILVDDGSPDNCPNICNQYAAIDSRIKTIHKNNGGLSSARNAGLDIATGDCINFIDSDDWIPKDSLEYLYNFIIKDNCDFVIGGNQRKTVYEEKEDYNFQEEVITQKQFLTRLFKIGTQENVQYAWAKLYRKELFNGVRYPVGLIDEDVPVTFSIALKAKKIGYSTKNVYYYYMNPSSITESKFSNKKLDLLKIWDIVCFEADKTQNKWIIKNAQLNRKRADFGILCNFAMDKKTSTKDANYKNIKIVLNNFKKHYFQLILSKIPWSRKILMTSFFVSYKFSIMVIRCFNKFGTE